MVAECVCYGDSLLLQSWARLLFSHASLARRVPSVSLTLLVCKTEEGGVTSAPVSQARQRIT